MKDFIPNSLRQVRVRIFIALASLFVYALMFLALYPKVGTAVATLTVFPGAVFGWFLGVRGGVAFAILAVPLNTFLFMLEGNISATALGPNLLGSAAFGLVSMGIGWVKALTQQVKQQAEGLRAEHALLQEEIVRRTRAEERLTHEALHDPLTNLPNRRLFLNRLEHALAWNKRNPDNLCAVLYLDLNRFKSVNDSLGHSAGDQLLIQVGGRLKASIRDVDTVARMGGDEFAVLLEAASTPEDAKTVIHRILENLARPYELQGHAIVSGASIGVVMGLASYEQLDSILKDADIAMYRAKASGDNQFRVFDLRMREDKAEPDQ